MNIGGIAKVTRDFESVVEGELSLRAGDLVQIVNSDNNDRHWAHLYCDDHEGEFPAGQLIALDCSDDILSHPEDLFVSKEDFYAEQDGDLSFSRGSVVSRTAIIDSNWSSGLVVFDGKTGRTVIGGKAGIFPLTFVWQIRRDLTTPSTYSANSNALNSADPRTPIATGIATDNLKAQLAEEVDLVKGDAVKIFSIHDRSYYNGECNGRRGIIPKAFVTLSKVDNVSAPRTVSPASRDTMPKFVEQSSAEDEPPTYENALRCPSVQEVDYATYQVNTDVVNSTQGVTSYCMTIYPFEGEFSTDLTFKSNEIVHIIRHVDADWLEGELNGRIGIFPKCFVKIVVDVHGHQEPVLQVDESNQEQMEVTNYPPDTYARVLFDFEAAHENDLAVKKNSTLTILRKLGEDWFEAMDDAGNIGEVPVVFVELIEERCHYTNDEDSSNAPLSRSTSAYEGEPLAASGPSLVTAAVLELSGSTISDFDPLDASSANVSHDSALLVAVNRSVSEDSQTTSSFSLRNITVNRTLPIRPAPPRPAAFTLSPRREPSEPSSTSSSSLPSSEDQEERRRQKVQEQRSCVIMELLQSERDYIRDLKVCYAQFEKPLISYPQLRGLIGNLSEVIQANQSLLSRLEVSSSRNGQGIGSCFLASADSLRPAYSIYCRNSDDVPVLFERLTSASGDSTIRQVLERSLKKIQEETNCFDIPSLLIKPVQRILKYPLLLSELAKCTTEATEVSEISKATTTMTDMATEINEMKRRKDMVFKYRKPSEVSSLTAKLSKINMHTLRKKGGRISARVYSTFGMSSVTKDEQFDEIQAKFRSLEKTIKIFLKDLQLFIEIKDVFVQTSYDLVESMANFYGDRSDQQEIKALGQLHKAVIDEYWVDMKRQFNINIVQVLTMLVAKFTSPIYLIQKRQDKLLDYENAMKKASWEKDALRAKQFKDELAQAKNNYEALNTQLLDELPRLVELSSELFLNCLAAFFNIKKLFIGRCSKQLLSLMELPLSYSGAIDVGDIRQTFQVKHNLIADDMTRSFSIISKGALDGTSTLERNGSIRSSTSSDTSTFRRSMFIGKGSRDENSLPQSTNAREAILAKFRQADIFTATADFQATDVMDMSLRRGDWVGAIKRQDPMGNGQRWFVTNGVKQGFVPMKFLGSGNQSLGSDAFSAWDMSESFVQSKSHGNLMSAQLDSVKRPAPGPPLPPKGTELATPPRPPPVISYQNVSDTSLIELDSPSHEQNESQGSGHSNYSNLVEFDPLAPLSATPPPLKPPPDVTGYEDVNSVYGHKYEDVEVEPQTDFYVASHAFGKDGPSFLTMKFGQVVKVKQKCDLTGNAEWWLVEDRDGRAGYVPANRLQKYTQ